MKRTFIALLFLCSLAFAANPPVGAISSQAVNQWGNPIPYAQIRICAVTSTGIPCTPTTNIYQDYALSIPLPNPFSADQFGNFLAYVPALAYPNLYDIQITAGHGIYWTYVVDGPNNGGVYILPPLTANTLGGVKGTGTSLLCPSGYVINGFNSDGSYSCTPLPGSLTLKTNGTNNASQSTLNLVNGTGITITNTSGGTVQISSSGGSGCTPSGPLYAVQSQSPLTDCYGDANLLWYPSPLGTNEGSELYLGGDGTGTTDLVVQGSTSSQDSVHVTGDYVYAVSNTATDSLSGVASNEFNTGFTGTGVSGIGNDYNGAGAFGVEGYAQCGFGATPPCGPLYDFHANAIASGQGSAQYGYEIDNVNGIAVHILDQAGHSAIVQEGTADINQFNGYVKLGTGVTTGTSPICPNGTGGALTTVGCTGGAITSIEANGTPITPSSGAVNFAAGTNVTLTTVGNTTTITSFIFPSNCTLLQSRDVGK